MQPVLTVHDLQVTFRTEGGLLPAVRGLSLEVFPGQTLAVVGESGSGKSAGSQAIMGLLPQSAQVQGGFHFHGQAFEPRFGEHRGRGLAMVFQNPMSSLNPVMRVGKQVEETVFHHQRASPSPALKARTKALELLTEVGLKDPEVVFRQYPHELSGGMRQRVLIAIALACEPEVLIADEPTTALDVTVASRVLELLKSLQHSRGMALILITHDMKVVEKTADSVLVMYAGQVVEKGPRQEVLEQPAHPYTKLLLACRPKLSSTDPPGRLPTIPGAPPRPRVGLTGCAFAERCPQAESRCHLEEPPEVTFGSERMARCWLVS